MESYRPIHEQLSPPDTRAPIASFADVHGVLENENISAEDKITFLIKEITKRASPEYIRDASDDFMPLLESLKAELSKKQISLAEVTTVVALETGAHLLGVMLQQAIQTMRKYTLHDTTQVELVSSVITRKKKAIEQIQSMLLNEDNGPLYTTGHVVIIDDVFFSGESIQQTVDLLQKEGVSSQDITAIVVAMAQTDDDEEDIPIALTSDIHLIVMDASDLPISRWISRPEGCTQPPEFHDSGYTKTNDGTLRYGNPYRGDPLQKVYRDFLSQEIDTAEAIGEQAGITMLLLSRS